jgi:hypothetical protein
MEREDDGLVSLVRGKVDFEAWRASLQSLYGAALNIAGARNSDAGALALLIVPEIPDPFDGV